MIKSNHTFTIKGINYTSTVIENLGESETLSVNEGICFVERITETSRKRLFATAPRLNTTFTQYEYSILETLEDLTIPELIKQGVAQDKFIVSKELTRQILNAPTGGESQLEFLGKNLISGLCERFDTDIKHDIRPYKFNAQTGLFEDIQPLILNLSVDGSTINITVHDSFTNPVFSLDNVNFQSELSFNNIAVGTHILYSKDDNGVLITQDFEIV